MPRNLRPKPRRPEQLGRTLAKSGASPVFALDEDLWFGQGDDVEAESQAASSLAAVVSRIVGAKPFPMAARRLDELTRDKNARIEQVVAVLESDPALSARLLRLVNSAGYALKIRCTSVRHAAVLVGSRRLNQLATTAAILDLFDANNERAIELLEHAAVVGSLCRYLAVHVGLPHDEMFTCGFLHDIGKLMLLDAERDRYADLLGEHGGQPDRMHLEERRAFGFDHAVLGAHVLAAWNIPEPVPKVIAWHHAPARAMQDTVLAAMVQTLRLADQLSYAVGVHDAQAGAELVAQSEAARYLDVSDVQLAAMWQDLAALRARSRARSHGEPELDAMLPKQEPESLRPKHSIGPRSSLSPLGPSLSPRPLQEVPVHFPCSVCGKHGYGNVCAACGGQVCPEHQDPADEWCVTCRRDFFAFRKVAGLSLWVKLAAGVAVAGTLAVAVVSAVASAESSAANWILGPLLIGALWMVILPVAYRTWIKLSFLSGRQRRESPPSQRVARSVTADPTLEESRALQETDGAHPASSPSGPLLSFGPISTASLPISIAPRSALPLSLSPVSIRPQSIAPIRSVAAGSNLVAQSAANDRSVSSAAPARSLTPVPDPAPGRVEPPVPAGEAASTTPETARSILSAPRLVVDPPTSPPAEVPFAEQVAAATSPVLESPNPGVQDDREPARESGAHPVPTRPPRPLKEVNSGPGRGLVVRCSTTILQPCVPSAAQRDTENVAASHASLGS